jgi:AraC-like DNA-binding protein
MAETAGYSARNTANSHEVDTLGNLLDALRIRGHLLFLESYAPPWRVAVPEAEALARALGEDGAVRALAFHVVLAGRMTLASPASGVVPLDAGDLVVCFAGREHEIGAGVAPRAVRVESLLARPPQRPRRAGDPKEHTRLLCGAFLVEPSPLNPLLAALPPVVRVPGPNWTEATRPTAIVQRLVHEVARPTAGGAFAIGRLLELLCGEVVRAHADAVPAGAVNWFAALRDPVVARVLSMIHGEPGRAWSVASLARAAHLSPSRMSMRFTSALGMGPMRYAARWRVLRATRLLRETELSVEQVGDRVGYPNPAAFSRVFRRLAGCSPTRWRREPRKSTPARVR